MHRIDTKTAQKDKFGAGKNGFTRGNPQTGTPATDLDDDYFDMLQEELCSVVEASGASLEKARHDQLLTALRALLLSRKNPFGDIKSDGTVKTALENLGLDIALAGKQDKTSQLSIFATGSDVQILKLLGLDTALAGKQPLDATLTNLSNKTVTQLLAYLGLAPAGNTSGNLALIGDTKNLADKCAVITKTGSNANGKYRVWSDGTIEMWGDGVANMNGGAVVNYPMTLPAKAQFIGATPLFLSSFSNRPTNTVMNVTDLTTTTEATFIVRRSDGTTSADGFFWSAKYAAF